jgi:hypothetical protein
MRFAMRKPKFTGEQIAFALKQAETRNWPPAQALQMPSAVIIVEKAPKSAG